MAGAGRAREGEREIVLAWERSVGWVGEWVGGWEGDCSHVDGRKGFVCAG